MKKTMSIIAVLMMMTIAFSGCTSDNTKKDENQQNSGNVVSDADQNVGQDVEDISYEGFAKGPNGEIATAANDIILTDSEYAKLKEGNYKAAMLWAGAGEWYNAMTDGAKSEFEKMGIKIVATSDAQFDPAKQATDIETALALKPDIILSLPVDPVSGTRAFKPAVDAGIRLIFADNGVEEYQPGKEYISIVTGDHYGMGRAAADLMAEALNEEGKIGFIYHDADFFVTNNRDNAFKSIIENKYPNIKIVASAGFSEEGATGDVAAAMLLQNPDLNGIYVAWDVAAEPVVAELRAAGKKDVKIVTHDLGGNNDLDMALGGNVYGKVADKPYQIGATMAILAAYDILGKEAPSFVLSDTVKMTKENMIEAWKESLNKEPSQNVIDALK